jgi:hypothetical protein
MMHNMQKRHMALHYGPVTVVVVAVVAFQAGISASMTPLPPFASNNAAKTAEGADAGNPGGNATA